MPYTAITHDSRHPFETCVLVAGVVAGVGAIAGGLWPSSLIEAFTPWAQTAWGIFFGGGALIALLGIIFKTRDLGIFFEQVGLIAFGSGCATYASALAIYNPEGGFAASALLALLAIASAVQWWRLEKFIRGQIAKGQRVRMRREADQNG